MQDAVTAWDLKPGENTNMVFNVLCNVKAIDHPWTWDSYLKQTTIKEWSRPQHRFEKCEGLKKCKLYNYDCGNSDWIYVEEDEKQTKWTWGVSNFTDVVTFQWYRIYMRKNVTNLSVYSDSNKRREFNWEDTNYVVNGWDGDKDTCDTDRPSQRQRERTINSTVTTETNPADQNSQLATYMTSSWHIRIYVQPVDTKACSWDTFDHADEWAIVLVKEYEAAECNPDHFVLWYGGIWTPKHIASDAKIAFMYYEWQIFAYIYNLDATLNKSSRLHLKDIWLYVSWVSQLDTTTTTIINSNSLPADWYFVPNVSELLQVFAYTDEQWSPTVIYDLWRIYWYEDFWEVPYFAAGGKLYSVNWFFTREDGKCDIPTDKELEDILKRQEYEPRDWCEALDVSKPNKRIFMFDNEIVPATIDWVITWLSRWGGRIAYVAENHLFISGNGTMNGIFSQDFSMKDTVRSMWWHLLPAWVTDVVEYNSSLLLLWPRWIYWLATEDSLIAGAYTIGTQIEDWYYSPGSYFFDDGEFLIVRKGKLLESLAFSVSYWSWSFQFQPDTWYFVNQHIKQCNNKYDIINIDATVNHRYVSIFDNNQLWPAYSKLLIYDKHYKCWYYWMITWARVIHVKDNIFLWDNIYVNKWRTRWRKDKDTEWWEIIEIISAYVWEQWLQTPKHIQYIKTAIWAWSVITTDSKWHIDASYGWNLYERTNDITTTRYPNLLLSNKRQGALKEYDDWQKIYWFWKTYDYTLLNEVTQYRAFDVYDKTVLREMWDVIDEYSRLALFCSIKEPVNTPANVLEISLSARGLDNVQFGSFYIGYYQLDADYEDIENTHIDISDYSDRTVGYTLDDINRWEYCEEVLQWSACDVKYDDNLLDYNQ